MYVHVGAVTEVHERVEEILSLCGEASVSGAESLELLRCVSVCVCACVSTVHCLRCVCVCPVSAVHCLRSFYCTYTVAIHITSNDEQGHSSMPR